MGNSNCVPRRPDGGSELPATPARELEPYARLQGDSNGCEIASASDRGITIRQLRHMFSCSLERCAAEGWTSADPRRQGEPLRRETITLYDLVPLFIKPATRGGAISLVELIAPAAQPPIWFVSHYWGEPVAEFIKCLERHSIDRGLGEDMPYWVCAYAIRQGPELGQKHSVTDPRATPFFDVIQRCTGGTVSILDSAGVIFNRSWCGYELSCTLQARGDDFMHDIYSAAAGQRGEEAVGLVDGFALSDREDVARRAAREAHFPRELLRLAAGFTLSSAKASFARDQRSILEAVGAAEPELNATVRARFLSVSLGHWLDSLSDLEQRADGGGAKAAAARAEIERSFALALHEMRGSLLRKVSLGLSRAEPSATRLAELFSALPPSTRWVLLAQSARGQTAHSEALVRPLRLHLRGWALSATDLASLGGACASSGLLELRLQDCGLEGEGAAELVAALSGLLPAGSELADDDAQQTRAACTLSRLHLPHNRIGEQGVSALARWLGSPGCPLETLQLESNALACSALVFGQLADALARSLHLQELNLASNALRDQGAELLADALARNDSLESLRLGYCLISDKGAISLAAGCAGNTALCSLSLDWNGIGEAGAAAWADTLAKSNRTLAMLDLRGNRLAEDVPAVRDMRRQEGEARLSGRELVVRV